MPSDTSLGPDTTMGDVLTAYPGAQRALFAKYHIGGCASCGFRPDETLGGVCERNEGIPVAEAIDHILESHAKDQARQINPLELKSQIIILTVFDDQEKVFKAICAGASGYLLKTSPAEAITDGIRDVMNGGAPMNGRIARMVLAMFSKMAPPLSNDYGLTERERQILNLMVEGLIKKEIADKLDVSFHTVDTHLRNIYTKLQVNTQTGAVAKALREGLIH